MAKYWLLAHLFPASGSIDKRLGILVWITNVVVLFAKYCVIWRRSKGNQILDYTQNFDGVISEKKSEMHPIGLPIVDFVWITSAIFTIPAFLVDLP